MLGRRRGRRVRAAPTTARANRPTHFATARAARQKKLSLPASEEASCQLRAAATHELEGREKGRGRESTAHCSLPRKHRNYSADVNEGGARWDGGAGRGGNFLL